MPDRGNGYEVCIRLTDTSTGGSRYLHQQLKAGDRLAISPPRNHFPLPEAGRYLLFAGGIGITPLLAMAEAIAARKGRWSCIIMSPARARRPSPRA